jgi:ATP-binding cassette subfamily B protein
MNKKEPKRLSRFFLHFASKHKYKFISLFLTATVWSITTAIFPFLIKIIVDSIVSFKGNPQDIYTVVGTPAVIYVVMRVLLSIFMRIENVIEVYTLPRIKAEIRSNMFESLSRHSFGFFQENMSGNISNKILNMANSFERIYTAIHDGLFPCIMTFIVSAILMWSAVPQFSIFFIVWFFLALTVTSYLSTRSITLSNERAEAESAIAGNTVDVFRNIVTVLTFFNIKRETKYLDKVQEGEIKAAKKLEWELIKIHIFRSASTTLMLVCMLVVLIEGWKNGWVTIGDFTFVSSTAFSMAHLTWYASKEFVTLYKEWGISRQAFSLLKTPYENTDLPGAKSLEISSGVIKFNNVTFKYPEGNDVFDKQSITINSGEKVGLVGFSGSGKTTFVKLIMRFFNPQKGHISIDDQDIRRTNKKSIRTNIAMIPQSPGLFNRSIAENILYGNPNASYEDMKEAAKKAHCEEFISELENGYETVVGEQGEKLSGGQRQRIAIARATIKDAPILILDEATSALDSATEQKIQQSVDSLMKDKTTIVIAHRLSTLMHLDRILVFDKGKIIEDGSHTELINKDGHYAMLWTMQTNGFILEESDIE